MSSSFAIFVIALVSGATGLGMISLWASIHGQTTLRGTYQLLMRMMLDKPEAEVVE